jgi:hypothetical protein
MALTREELRMKLGAARCQSQSKLVDVEAAPMAPL